MEKILVAKTILEVLPRIEKYCQLIANHNHSRAVNSYALDYQASYNLMERIIDKTYKAQQLNNLKIKAERLIESAPRKTKQVLELYPDVDAVEKKLGISKSNAYRLAGDAVQWFADNLDNAKINPEVALQLFATVSWTRI